jgi:hypothetical protein
VELYEKVLARCWERGHPPLAERKEVGDERDQTISSLYPMFWCPSAGQLDRKATAASIREAQHLFPEHRGGDQGLCGGEAKAGAEETNGIQGI